MNGIEEVRKVIDLLTPQLQAEGYSVYRQPSRLFLPAFMNGYVPDAIAIRLKDDGSAKKNLAIEVKIEGYASNADLAGLTKLFADIPDWELRVYYARPGGELEDMPTMSREIIDNALGSVSSLIAADQLRAALMLGWATIEAIGRSVSPHRLGRAKGSRALIETLANEGIVTQDEADRLRRLSVLRNRVAHGALDEHVSREDLGELVEVLGAMRTLAWAAEAAPTF